MMYIAVAALMGLAFYVFTAHAEPDEPNENTPITDTDEWTDLQAIPKPKPVVKKLTKPRASFKGRTGEGCPPCLCQCVMPKKAEATATIPNPYTR